MSFVFDKLNEDDFMLLGSMMLKTRFDKPLKLVYGMKWCRDRIADAYLIDIDGGMCFDPTFFVF